MYPANVTGLKEYFAAIQNGVDHAQWAPAVK
jgi:hypothetical protein